MKKSFDAVAWMRERRRQIEEEDRGLTWAERSRKTRQIVLRDPVLGKLCRNVVRPEQLHPLNVRERAAGYGTRRKGARAARNDR